MPFNIICQYINIIFDPFKFMNYNIKDQMNSSQEQQSQSNTIIDEIYSTLQKVFNFELEGQCVKQTSIKNVMQIQRQANQGNARACFLLGRAYDKGLGFEKDINKAIEWYLMARKLGESLCLYNAYDIIEDKTLKQTILQEGVRKGDHRCTDQRVQLYLKHEGPDRADKLRQSQEFIKGLLDQNYIRGHYLAWMSLIKQDSEFYNKQKAREHLKAWTEKRYIKKECTKIHYCRILSDFNFYDEAVPGLIQVYENPQLYEKVQKTELEVEIGKCFHKLNDLEKAKQWYLKATMKNYLTAFNRLASIYSQQNQDQLYKQILQKAIKLQNNQRNSLSIAFYNMGVHLNDANQFEQQFIYHYQAANLGDLDSSAICGYLLYQGRGVNQDIMRGKQIIEQAANKGNNTAKNYLQRIKRKN